MFCKWKLVAEKETRSKVIVILASSHSDPKRWLHVPNICSFTWLYVVQVHVPFTAALGQSVPHVKLKVAVLL